jgi:alkylresorcinol/alkylpyrone synthase
MATITATATAVPDHRYCQDEVKLRPRSMSVEPRRMATVQAIIENAGVRQRFGVETLDYVMTPRPLSQTSRQYQTHAVELGRRVARQCLDRAGLDPSQVDYVITVSCTGVMIPSLDAYLINDLGMRPDVRRLPITELGCAGGAVALSRAHEFARAFPEANVLVVAVELSSLTFQQGDASMANIVSGALFGDGAAAALVTGRPGRGAEVIDTESHLFPGSYDTMGFDLRETGLHIVLSKHVGELIRAGLGPVLDRLLARNRLGRADLRFFVLHPGGRKVLEIMEEELQLPRELTQPSWNVLAEYGNLSSATVLFVLDEWLTSRTRVPGERGIMAAFGPGFSAELLLLRWS